MTDSVTWADAVQAVAEVALLVLGVAVFWRDGLRAKRAEALAERAEQRAVQAEERAKQSEDQTVSLAVEAQQEQSAVADRLEAVSTPERAAELAQEIRREPSLIERWYENAVAPAVKVPDSASIAKLAGQMSKPLSSEQIRQMLQAGVPSTQRLQAELAELAARYPGATVREVRERERERREASDE